MAKSICPYCENGIFEAVKYKPIGLPYSVTFIQCSQCGRVIGVLNTEVLGVHINNGIEALAKIINNK